MAIHILTASKVLPRVGTGYGGPVRSVRRTSGKSDWSPCSGHTGLDGLWLSSLRDAAASVHVFIPSFKQIQESQLIHNSLPCFLFS